ncbi:putative General secretion pathway protein I precursor [Bradyrhizobium sp. ORS 375]|uniref:type IV pilus modification PilV family protein n=1 Tax=Bradyrhizobium sp. (strain ORS 375) TaxID=566679 RepID=UPI0002407A74|nr:type II secretion system protein [Bradyrhizobium sp. ORS 375]CCD93743.1 putative General secretion pathway protein I precursor [Bradyrhizobium sp. ORS 375]
MTPVAAMTRSADADEAGFTLVEVIVALGMLSLGLTIVMSLLSTGLARTGMAERLAGAVSLAQSVLAQAVSPLRIETREGTEPSGYRWQLAIQPYRAGPAEQARPIELYQVSVVVGWREGQDTRSYVLSTLRLGPRVTPSQSASR